MRSVITYNFSTFLLELILIFNIMISDGDKIKKYTADAFGIYNFRSKRNLHYKSKLSRICLNSSGDDVRNSSSNDSIIDYLNTSLKQESLINYWREDNDLFHVDYYSNHTDHDQLPQHQIVDRKLIQFKVRGNPRPLTRHRTSRGFMYNPSAKYQNEFRNVVLNMLESKLDKSNVKNDNDRKKNKTSITPLFRENQLVELRLLFRLKRPKIHFINSIPGEGRLKPTAPSSVSMSRTDIDNLVKFVLDAMNGVLYSDDKQVVSLRATKILDSEGCCEGSTEVSVLHFTEDDFLL